MLARLLCVLALAATCSSVTPARGDAAVFGRAAINARANTGSDCKQARSKRLSYGFDYYPVAFPAICNTSGTITVPTFTQTGSSSNYGMWTFVCANDQPVFGTRSHCSATPDPRHFCKQAKSTFWYMSVTFKARNLEGSGGMNIQFHSGTFPIAFTSSTYIQPGYVYGLCVIGPDGKIQDDFGRKGHPVSPSGNTINLTMVLPQQYLFFYYKEYFALYLESKPSGA